MARPATKPAASFRLFGRWIVIFAKLPDRRHDRLSVVGDLRFDTPLDMRRRTFARWIGGAKVYSGVRQVATLRGRGDPVALRIATDDGGWSRELLLDGKDAALRFIASVLPKWDGGYPSVAKVERAWSERGGDGMWD